MIQIKYKVERNQTFPSKDCEALKYVAWKGWRSL